MEKGTWHWEKIHSALPASLIMIGGFCLLIFGLNHESAWNDEVLTWAFVNQPLFSDTWRLLINDVHPPLYYLMLKVFGLMFGYSLVAIRLFSVLGAVALAALGLGPIRRAFGRKAGLLYSGMIFLTPAALAVAQEARMYSWAAFFVTGAISYAYLAGVGNKPSDWVKLGLCALGAAYTHYYAFLAVAIASLLLLIWLFTNERRRLFPCLITLGAVIIGYLPWVSPLIAQMSKVTKNYWIPPVSAAMIRDTFLFPFGDKFQQGRGLFIFQISAFGLAWIMILWGLWRTWRERGIKKETGGWLGGLGMATYLLTVLAVIAFSYLARPMLEPRYTFVIIGLLIEGMAIGLAAVKWKMVFRGVLLLGLVFSCFGLVPIYQQRFNGPMKEVAAYVKPKLSAEAVFVHFDPSWHTLNTFCYYFPNNRHLMYIPTQDRNYVDGIFAGRQGMTGSDVDSFLVNQKDIWFVTRLGMPGDDTAAKMMAKNKLCVVAPPKKFQLPYSWYGVSLYRLTPQAP